MRKILHSGGFLNVLNSCSSKEKSNPDFGKERRGTMTTGTVKEEAGNDLQAEKLNSKEEPWPTIKSSANKCIIMCCE